MTQPSNGTYPALTLALREDIARVIRRRREIEAAIDGLRAEFAALPTNAQLVESYGVTTSTLHNCCHRKYTRKHPLDSIPHGDTRP